MNGRLVFPVLTVCGSATAFVPPCAPSLKCNFVSTGCPFHGKFKTPEGFRRLSGPGNTGRCSRYTYNPPRAGGEVADVPALAVEDDHSADDAPTVIVEEDRHTDDIEDKTDPFTEPNSLSAFLLLNLVTVLWGTQHAVIKLILQDDLPPGVTNLARFGLAALIFSPWTPGLLREAPRLPFSPPLLDKEWKGGEADGGGNGVVASAAETWRAGGELGVWMFLGFAFQAVGLGFTTASRSAFLLYLNVKLVPFLSFALFGRSLSVRTWTSAVIAFLGTAMLSYDGSPPNIGDAWSVAAAVTSAMFILRLEKYSVRCDASKLNSANLWVTAGLCGVWAGLEVLSGEVNPRSALETLWEQVPLITYLAVVTTALTNWLQALGQRSVPAEQAAIIYAMDPVYAAGFAYVLLGEKLGALGLVGAAVIAGAAFLSQAERVTE
ncbi:unnamed protein product, partial [Discosporangium mesarthrocarpum]